MAFRAHSNLQLFYINYNQNGGNLQHMDQLLQHTTKCNSKFQMSLEKKTKYPHIHQNYWQSKEFQLQYK